MTIVQKIRRRLALLRHYGAMRADHRDFVVLACWATAHGRSFTYHPNAGDL